MSNQTFGLNPEPRCACVLVLDASASMDGPPLQELSAGLQRFFQEVSADRLASRRVEVAIVVFGETVRVVRPFGLIAAAEREIPLEAAGKSPIGAALYAALDLLDERTAAYESHGLSFFRPWVFLISDGAPTDDTLAASTRIQQADGNGSLCFFPVAVAGADVNVLSSLGIRRAMPLKGLHFQDLFVWLSVALKQVSRSRPGDRVPLPPVDGKYGWTEV